MWKCVFDSATGKGVAFGRSAGGGEFMVELPPSSCAWFNVTPERYQYVDGSFSERSEWQAEREEAQLAAALQSLRDRIIAKRQEKNSADFLYNGTLFVSDEPNIQGVRLRIEGLTDSDPIPTFTGTDLASTWRSAENTFVPFTCGEFRTFSNFYYNHREKNFTNYTVLTIAALTAYANGATVEELNNFDISQGWD